MNPEQIQILDTLSYELRMLMGAARMTSLFEERAFGNTCNYFKDSVYLHSRNLYNFFLGTKPKHFDLRLMFGLQKFSSSLWEKWSVPLQHYVLHIEHPRDHLHFSNSIDGVHINQMPQAFTDDIIHLWKEWIGLTPQSEVKERLEEILDDATEASDDDFRNSKAMLR